MSVVSRAFFVIERNLYRDLSLSEIARNCDVSRFHLAHAFGEATGQPVMEYVRARRLTEAAYALASGTQDILGLALDIGYASHEAFTRAFKAHHGKTPEEVRAAESVQGLRIVEPLRRAGRPKVALKPPRFVREGELLFVGLREVRPYAETEHIPGQWLRFMSGPYEEIEYRKPGIPVGVNIDDEDGENPAYMCAAEVSRYGRIPEGLSKITMAPSLYAVFAHDGHVTTLHDTYSSIWNDWLAESARKPVQAPSFERHNPAFDPRTGNGGFTIWIPLAEPQSAP